LSSQAPVGAATEEHVVGLTKGGFDEDTPVPEALGAELMPVPEIGALEVIGTLALELETTVERVW